MFLNAPLAGDQRVFKEARTLADAGYEVSIICNQIPELESEIWRGIKVLSIPRRPSVLFPGRFTFDWIRKAILLRPDIIHAHDLNTLGRAAIVSLIARAGLVYDSHDWYTQTPAKLRLPRYRQWYYRLKERLLIKLAAAVIFPVPKLCEIAAREFGIPEPACICNFPRGEFIPKQDLLREELGIPEEDKIVLYEGVLAGDRGLEEIVLSARHIDNSIRIVFIGDGYLKGRLRQLARENGLEEKVKFLDAVSVEIFPLYCAGADAGIVIYHVEGLTTFHGWPTKVFDYLRAGLPVLIAAGPEITDLVLSNQAGEPIADTSPRGIAREINHLFQDREKFERLSDNAVKTWREKFNWDSEAEKLLKLYRSLED